MEDDEEVGTLGQIRDQLSEAFDPSTTPEAQGYARKFLNKQLNSPITNQQNEILTQMEKEAAKAQSVLRAARQKLMARRYNPADKWYALSKALGAPTQVGGVGELASRAAGALGESSKAKQTYEETQDKDALGMDETMSKLQMELLALKSGVLTGQGKNDVELAKESLKTLGRRVSPGVQNKAQQAVDREFAKDYLEWIQQGAPESEKTQTELGMARDRLRGYTVDENGERVPIKEDDYLSRALGPTGRVAGTIGTIPFAGKAMQDVLMPGAADIRELVESTVQRSLRPILGAQFTEKEGERLIARVYNPRLKPEINASRVERLLKQVKEASANKTAAAKWFEDHGTLQGFQGKFRYTMADFMPKDINELAPQAEDSNADDEIPAIEPGAAVGEPAQNSPEGVRRTIGGRPVYRIDELPKKRIKKKIDWLGFAEGGAVAKPGTVLVELKDGTLVEADAGATQEDVLGGDDGDGYDPTISRAALAALGAGTGYVGGRMLAGTSTGLKDLAKGERETPAQARLLRIMETSGLPPDQVTSTIRRLRRMGVPAMPLDASPNLRGALETAIPQGGSESMDLMDRLSTRQSGARDRAMEQVNRGLKPDDYFDKEEEIKTKLYGDKTKGIESESSPLYKAAEAQFPAVRSVQLGKLLDTPSGQKAVKAARKTMEDKGQSIGKVNAVTGAVMKPSLAFLNQVKIEMDNLIGQAKTKGAMGRVRDLTNLKKAFVTELDTATTDPATNSSPYQEARGVYEQRKQHLDTLQMGREEFGKMQPQEVQRAVAGMNFEQKDAFRTGVAQKISEMLNTPSVDINAAKRLVGSPAMQAKLQALFDTPAEFRIFQTALQKEMEMFEGSQRLLGQEGTIRKRGAAPPQGLIERGAEKAPALGIFSPTHWALKYLRRKPEIDSKQAREVINLLKSSTPDELQHFEKQLGPKFGRKALRKKRSGRIGMAGAALGAIAGALSGGDDEEEIDPALVGLSDEEKEMAMRPAKAEGGRIKRVYGSSVGKRGPIEALRYALSSKEAPRVQSINSQVERMSKAGGGKVDQAKELIELLKRKNAEMPMDAETLKHHIYNIANKIGEMPNTVWKMFNGVDQGASTPMPNPAMRGTVPVTPTRVPAQPEQLAPFARSMDFEKARLQQIMESLNQRPDLAGPRAEGLATSGLAANTAYDRMMSDPSPDNMQRLSELVRSLSEQAKRGGGRVRRQFGGGTNHG